MSSQPLVSVCIASYNHERYVGDAIESVVRQRYSNWELIVVDDASTDESPRILDALAQRLGPRMKFLPLTRNVGVSTALNTAIEQAQGKYIALLGSDDRMREDRLEKQVSYLETHLDVGAVCSRVACIDAKGRPLNNALSLFDKEITNLRLQLLSGNFLNAPSFLIRRSVWEDVGVFHTALQYVQDYDYWLRMLGRHELVRLPERLTEYRIHGENLSVSSFEGAALASAYETLIVIQRAIHRLSIEQVFGIEEPHESQEWRRRVADAKLSLAATCMRLDEHLFGRPFIGLATAYELALGAVDLQPTSGKARMLLAKVYTAFGDEPRARGERSTTRGQRLGKGAEAPSGSEEGVLTRTPANDKYEHWLAVHALCESDAQVMAERMMRTWRYQPSFHLITVLQPGQEGRIAETLAMLGEQLYSGWGWSVLATTPAPDPVFDKLDMIEWIEARGDLVAALQRTVQESPADWIGVIEAGDRLAAHALICFGDYINCNPQWQFIYVDEDRIDDSGNRSDPRFKPDFNLDLLRSTPYMGAFGLIRRDALVDVGGIHWLAEIGVFDLVFRMLERSGEEVIGHIADVLFHRYEGNDARYDRAALEQQARHVLEEHLARVGVTANISAGYSPLSFNVEYQHGETPLVSIIIPTKDQIDYLKPCVDSLLQKTEYPNYEVIVIDNNTSEPQALEYLAMLESDRERVRVLRYPHPYNYSAINNMAAREAKGDYLLLLNNDTIIVQNNWLDRMMAHGQRPEVGVVGARLVFPDQRIQHAGVIMGMTGVADHVGIGLPMTDAGHMGRAQLVQNFSAVTAACLLVKKSLFFEVHGFDEEGLKVLFNDVDLCLKIGEQGYKIVWTPFATLVHHGSGSLRKEPDPKHLQRAQREQQVMLDRWLPRIGADPAYNRNLSLIRRRWDIENEVDIPWDPDLPGPARVMAIGFGSLGSWQHRVVAPLGALQGHAKAQCALLPRYKKRLRIPSVAELARANPDALLLHNTVHDLQIEGLKSYKRFNDVFLVFGQDDLVFELPAKNPFRKDAYKDIKKRVRTCLSLCDRLIVTTEPLAHAYGKMIDDIRVVPNYLERERWDSLVSKRRQGARPRVGWAGAEQHQGDLEVLSEVVKATADEVDWVFFGMCPEEIRPYIREFHSPVSFDNYAAKLANLNLDLAVAPLEHNRFNEAKSNLRLLEYGILGWPVVCTDIHPYCGAPVARVPNNPRAWIGAIRDRIHDLDATEREGEQLRQWILEHWMLEDHLDEWLAALLSDAQAALSSEITPSLKRIAVRP